MGAKTITKINATKIKMQNYNKNIDDIIAKLHLLNIEAEKVIRSENTRKRTQQYACDRK